jgi:23S rRNA pseudouridine1911/1915/1917 synthase
MQRAHDDEEGNVIQPETMNVPSIDVIYEDDRITVVSKPSGLSVHRDQFMKPEVVTLADWHVARSPESAEVGEPLKLSSGLFARPGVVHRLDRETSGVIVLAKTPEAHTHLKAQFHDRLVEKEYRAFVYGALATPRGTIDRPITRSAKDFRLRSAQRGGKGTARDALTHFECLASCSTHSYVRLMPETGRTHQLRVHMKAINHPIVCDRLYAPNHTCALTDAFQFTRLALHAYTLTLTLTTGKSMTFTASLPSEFHTAEVLCRAPETPENRLHAAI